MIGQRVICHGHTGTITGQSESGWFHIKWDNWLTNLCNYWGAHEFQIVKEENHVEK